MEFPRTANDSPPIKKRMMKEYKYTINGNKYEVVIGDISDCVATLTVNGENYTVEMERPAEPEKKKPTIKPAAAAPAAPVNKENTSSAVNKANAVKAPLPGVVTEILVEVGQEVKAGDNVVVLEAMKMANNLQTEKDGKVTAICVQAGQNVMEDEPLLIIE